MAGLISDSFLQDPRVNEAFQLIHDVYLEITSSLSSSQNSDLSLSNAYQDLLDQCSSARGGQLYYPYLGSGIGKGSLVELADGSVKYDFITGIGVHYLGHSNPELMKRLLKAAVSDTVMQGNLQQNVNSAELMEQFLTLANGSDLAHCFLSTSGAQANENALKMAFQKKAPADRVLAFEHCFAGRTLALAHITDKALYRDGLPKTLTVDYLPFYNADHPEKSLQRTLHKLRTLLERYPKQYAVMSFELIQGEGGYYPGDEGFFKEIIKVLKGHDIAVWVDEVQTFGRTIKPFAYQYFNLDKEVDIVTVGKMSQVCATLFKDDYKARPGLISQTFTSSSSAIEAAKYILELLAGHDLCGTKGKIAKFEKLFHSKIEALAKKYEGHFIGPYGVGGMLAFTIFDGDLTKTKEFCNRLFDNGVMAFLAGRDPMRVRMLPPMAVVTEAEVDEVFRIVDLSFREMLES